MAAIKKAFDDSRGRYGARKVWHQLRRKGHDIARCTVERLMKVMGLQGVVRGKKVVTTNPDTAQPCPDDKVNRAFVANMPNQLWVSDFTYVSSWQGMVYVAFVIDEYGDFRGIATLNDVLGGIAGELPEEHQPITPNVVRRPDGSWLVDGSTPIADVVALVAWLRERGPVELVTAPSLARRVDDASAVNLLECVDELSRQATGGP